MTRKIHPKDNSQNAQTLLTALQKAGVDLRDEPGTPGKLWRALAAGARAGLTPEFLAEIQARSEMHTEIEAVAARFDATGNQNPADLGFLLLGLFCEFTPDAFEMAGEMLALLHAKRAGRTAPAEGDALAVRLSSYFQRPRCLSPAGGNSATLGQAS
jgi:hypothetical protein